jgi:hypothetical protein
MATSAARFGGSSTDCSGRVGVELEACLRHSSADSPHADLHACRVLAEEEREDARRQPPEAP